MHSVPQIPQDRHGDPLYARVGKRWPIVRNLFFLLTLGVKPHIWMDAGLLLMFYALYYGVLARDVAEICTEKMVAGIGVCIYVDFYIFFSFRFDTEFEFKYP